MTETGFSSILNNRDFELLGFMLDVERTASIMALAYYAVSQLCCDLPAIGLWDTSKGSGWAHIW
jgi:hypothetical protein